MDMMYNVVTKGTYFADNLHPCKLYIVIHHSLVYVRYYVTMDMMYNAVINQV